MLGLCRPPARLPRGYTGHIFAWIGDMFRLPSRLVSRGWTVPTRGSTGRLQDKQLLDRKRALTPIPDRVNPDEP